MKNNTISQLTNKESDIKAIMDGYMQAVDHPLYKAESLQKDAIQNSWDARSDKKNGENWKCVFDLKRMSGKDFLIITDEGTKGLIGTKFKDADEVRKILNEKKEGEDLANFCNSNWSVKSQGDAGNRGRGKTVLLDASGGKCIYFDSYRSSDDEYVLVKLFLDDKDKDIKYSLNWNDDAKVELKKISDNALFPLSKHGTRILIPDPEAKIREAINQGDFLSYINNTWWEIIKKYNAKIVVNSRDNEKIASMPIWYEKNKDDIKVDNIEESSYSSEFININDKANKIEKMVLRYSSEQDVPGKIKGIAIQRGGMTIERLKTDDMVREESIGNIYGWVEMNKELSKEMKDNCEGPEHFSYSWTKKPANHLKSCIKIKIREFAKELKLIETENAKKDRIQKQASDSAIKNLTPLFKKLNLSGSGSDTPKTRKGETRGSNEKLRLSVTNFELPNENSRVNYSQKIKGTYVVPINEYEEDFFVGIKVWVESDDGQEIIIEERELNLRAGQRDIMVGADFFEIDKKFNKGKYSFKAQMLSLEDTDKKIQVGKNEVSVEKGTILYDNISKKFYVEEDPPEKGPFDFQPYPSDDKRKLIWHDYNTIDHDLVFYYNSKHPKIIPIIEEIDSLTEYLIGQGTMLLYQIKIESLLELDSSTIDKFDPDLHGIIKSKNIDQIFPYLLEKYSEQMWDYLK